tara:strand:+ start:765 stop:2117 length:1353 start_codon:yes stop_codon:yes gene_type:complete
MSKKLRSSVLLAALEKILNYKSFQRKRRFILKYHPGEIAIVFPLLQKENREKLFNLVLKIPRPQLILEKMEEDVLAQQISRLETHHALKIIRKIPLDIATAVIRLLPEEKKDEITSRLTKQNHSISDLLKFDEDTAAGRMDSLPAFVSINSNVREALSKLAGFDDDFASVVYVVDEQKKLIGFATLKKLSESKKNISISKVVVRDVISVSLSDDKEEAIKVFERYGLLLVPVTDEKGVLCGVLTADDIVDIVQEEATEDVFLLAGLSEEELTVNQSTWKIASRRMSWLFLTLVGSFITGKILETKGHSIENFVLLLAFLPLIMALGGVIGNQSSVIVVRALATNRLSLEKPWPFVLKQFKVGFAMALFCTLAVFLIAYFFSGEAIQGNQFEVVGLSLAGAIIVGNIVGTGIPLLMSLKKIDPAISSAPLISTICDITGVTIYTSLIINLL